MTKNNVIDMPAPADPMGEILTHDPESGRRRSQADILIDIGNRHGLFHDSGGDAFARIGAMCFPVESLSYKEQLSRQFYELTERGPNRNALSDATATLAAVAKFDGPQSEVWLRTAALDDDISIDIGDQASTAIMITSAGWEVGPNRRAHFIRTGKMTALPTPGAPGDVTKLWQYINIEQGDRPLMLAWLISALRPVGPYPICMLHAEQGAGKSSAARTLKALTDPSAVPLRPSPKDEVALGVSALASRVLALDNLSSTNPAIADTLCRLATGGGLAARKLYSDTDEILLEVQRPVILNGINDLAARPDLADRCLNFHLPEITTRRRESELNEQFNQDAPAIMAGLLDGLSLAIKNHRTQSLTNPPRMADFAAFAAAAMPALGYAPSDFLNAYQTNRRGITDAALEASPIAQAIQQFIADRGEWLGPGFDLLGILAERYPSLASADNWPRTTRGFTSAVERIKPALRAAGISVTKERSNTSRNINIRKIEQ